MINRKQLTITIAMLEAGERAMALCRDTGGHTPRTACHAIFQAMLAVSEWSPAIRIRPGDRRKPSRAAFHPLEWYHGKTLGLYHWHAFHAASGLHYLKTPDYPEKWIRLTDAQWEKEDVLFGLERGWFYVPGHTADIYVGKPYVPTTPRRRRKPQLEFVPK